MLFGELPLLKPWAFTYEVQIPWGCHTVRKFISDLIERPHWELRGYWVLQYLNNSVIKRNDWPAPTLSPALLQCQPDNMATAWETPRFVQPSLFWIPDTHKTVRDNRVLSNHWVWGWFILICLIFQICFITKPPFLAKKWGITVINKT